MHEVRHSSYPKRGYGCSHCKWWGTCAHSLILGKNYEVMHNIRRGVGPLQMRKLRHFNQGNKPFWDMADTMLQHYLGWGQFVWIHGNLTVHSYRVHHTSKRQMKRDHWGNRFHCLREISDMCNVSTLALYCQKLLACTTHSFKPMSIIVIDRMHIFLCALQSLHII